MARSATSGLFAVLTGDLVRSRDLDPGDRDRALREIEDTVEEFGSLRTPDSRSRIDVFRGDAWQTVLSEPGLSVELALLIRARLRALPGRGGTVDTRVAIGIGPVERLDPEHASRGQGAAFEASGRALDELEAGRRMTGEVAPRVGGPDTAAFATLLVLLDAITRRWNERRSRAVAGALAGRTQQEIGDGWPGGRISQQAVGQHLDAAYWEAVETTVEYFRTCWSAHDLEKGSP